MTTTTKPARRPKRTPAAGRLRSQHLEIAPRRMPPGPARATGTDLPWLLMAVPKRLLKRAVDRNALKRVIRESARAQGWPTEVASSRFSLSQDTSSADQGSARPTMSGATAPRPALIRLVQRPEHFLALGRPARKRFWRTEVEPLLRRWIHG